MPELVYLLSDVPRCGNEFTFAHMSEPGQRWRLETHPALAALGYAPGNVSNILYVCDAAGHSGVVHPATDTSDFNGYSPPGHSRDSAASTRRLLETHLAMAEQWGFGHRGILHRAHAEAFLDIARTLGFEPREVRLRQL